MTKKHYWHLPALGMIMALVLAACAQNSPTVISGKLDTSLAAATIAAVKTNSPGEVINSATVNADGTFSLNVDVESENTHIVIILSNGTVLKFHFDSEDASGVVSKLSLKKGLGTIDLGVITITNGTVVIKLKIKNITGHHDDLSDDGEDAAVIIALKAKFPTKNLGCSIWSTQPRSNAVVEEGGKKIKLRFALPVDQATITADNIKLTGPNGAVALTFPARFNEHDRQVKLHPVEALTPGAYSITVSTNVKCGTGDAATPLAQSNFQVNFSVVADDDDEDELEIESVSPIKDESDVAVNTTISVTFETNLEPTTVSNTAGSFQLFLASNVTIPISGAIVVVDKTLTFTPAAALEPGKEYKFVVGTGIKDSNGNALEEAKTFKFTTAP